jgi:hypothetical protein
MTVSRRTLCIVYGLIAVLALIGTWGNNMAYLSLGFLGANQKFWGDTLANPASRSITVDIFFLSLAVLVWMVLEARRLRMRGVWLYVVFGFLVAISVTVPIFLINRERRLAQVEAQGANAMGGADAAGLALLGIAFAVYAVLTLLHGGQ